MSAEVERIVREVLERLRVPGNGEKCGENAAVAATKQPANDAVSLALSGRVIAVADLSGRLDGVQVVVVPRKAIVTPAARDLLRERGVTLASRAVPAETRTAARLTLGVAETRCDAAELVRGMREDGVEVEQLARSGLAGVVEELADQIARGGRLGMLLTDNPLAALCRANRHRGVRAAQGNDAWQVGRAIAAIEANLLVVEPHGRGTFVLRQAVRAFCRGANGCPAEWRGV